RSTLAAGRAGRECDRCCAGSSEVHRHENLEYVRAEFVQGFRARTVLRNAEILDVAEVEIVEADAARVEGDGAALEESPAVRQKGVGHLCADRDVVQGRQIL